MNFLRAIGRRGQVTIPREVRAHLGVKSGDRVEFVVEAGEVVIRPVREGPNPFDAYVGALATFPGGKKAINTWLKTLRGRD